MSMPAMQAAPEYALESFDLLDIAEARLWLIGGQVQGIGEQLPDFPLVHRFTPGLYIREIFMPAGSIVISRTHKTEHPFLISKGHVSVYCEEFGWQHLQAPHTGITKVGTRRLLFMHEDTIWTTFHVTELTDVADIEREITETHENALIAEIQQERIA